MFYKPKGDQHVQSIMSKRRDGSRVKIKAGRGKAMLKELVSHNKHRN